MDPLVEEQLRHAAQEQNLKVDQSFTRHLDSYTEKFFRGRPNRDRLVIQTYLAAAGLRIAKTEGKQVLQLDDAKAAIYYFHLPDDPDSDCVAAGNRVLREEQRRSRNQRGLVLNENLREFLDQTLK